MGTSVIMSNSPKGKWMVKQSKKLHVVKASWEEILPLNQNLFMPTNRYAFKGYDKVHILLKIPEPFRKFLFMNGSTNKFIDKLYSIVANILLSSKRAKTEAEIKEHLKKTLEYLNKNKKET